MYPLSPWVFLPTCYRNTRLRLSHCLWCGLDVRIGQRRTSDPLEVELQMFVNPDVSTWKTWVPWKKS